MQNYFNRRQAIKLLVGVFFSIFGFLFGKKINSNIDAGVKSMNGIKSITDLPNSGPWPTKDPFLFCVHHNDEYPNATKNFMPEASLRGRNIGNDFSSKNGWSMYHGESIPGFPKHPHRGFETLTVVDKGIVDHSDSLGASARYGDGDAQWLTAGDGINHSEMFPLFNQISNNPIDFFQIWINLPAKNKRVEPNFQMFWEKQIPKVEVKDENGIISIIELISGELNGIKSPAPPPDSWANDKDNQVAVWVIRLKSNGLFVIPKTDEAIHRNIYILKDSKINLNNNSIRSNTLVELSPDENITLENKGNDAKILMLQGRPIEEPVVQYGPFVMNTKSEIEEAFSDYNKTGFGGWSWDRPDPVHGKYKGKFAKLINGNLDKPS